MRLMDRARAKSKSKSKKNQSPDRPKPSTKALFPQKVLLLTPLKKKSKVKKDFDLEETESNTPTCKEVMTKEDWMRDSDFAMARDASSYQERERERGEGWWVGFGRDSAGKRFGKDLEGILGEFKDGNESVEGKGRRAMKAGTELNRSIPEILAETSGDKAAEVDKLFNRSDCLDLPHWLRYLPRQRPIKPETPRRG
jgi:hypothetical protein